MMTIAANDTKLATKHAGRDVWKAINTTRSAVDAGNYTRARNATRYALPRLGIKLAVPSSEERATWDLVIRAMVAIAEGIDAEAIRQQASR